jgi:GntR family transcriptional regulator/MocR family aminotransferase
VTARPEPTKYARLQGALRDAVRSGRLEPGRALPSTRALAADLGVSRGVVVEAYEQLVAEGYLVSRHGSGTHVAPGVAERASAPPPPSAGRRWLVDFDPGCPDLGAFPRAAWAGAVRSALLELTAAELGYGNPGGDPVLRHELAAYLGRVRGADADPERLVVVGGFTQGLGLVARGLRAVGERRVMVEDPGAFVQRRSLEAAGLTLEPCPVDGDGFTLHRLGEGPARTVMVTPAHQYPLGVVMGAERRAGLLGWVRDGGRRTIIEDDYDAEFRYDRAPVGCLQGVAPDHVAMGGSVSKSLAPGVRLGWFALPPGLAPVVGDIQETDRLQPPVVSQRALAHLLSSGRYDRHIRRMRARYRERRDALVESLGDRVEVRGVSAGLHLVVTLPPESDDVVIARAVAERGVFVRPLRTYHVGVDAGPGLVLGYAHLPLSQVARGGAVVREVLENGTTARTR